MQDPRRITKGNLRHQLTDIIFLVVSAVISGAEDWTDIELFGKSQIHWLRKFVPLKKGVPSHDTLSRVFAAIDYNEFNNYFIKWTQSLHTQTSGEVVAIDGKRIRGSYDHFNEIKATHIISAFAAENNICLGQSACESKSNEITAIPKLLDLIAIKGCVVTIDAMGCQKEIAQKIRDRQANYILAVKSNQKTLYEQLKKLFDSNSPNTSNTQTDSGHGRVEKRQCDVIRNLKFLDNKEDWKDLGSIIRIQSQRYDKLNSQTQHEVRYYISDLKVDAKEFNKKIRQHWSIENNLHWMLDVVFKEDNARKRIGNSAKNFNLVAKTALNLLVLNQTKASKKSKRLKAAICTDFRETVLNL